MAWALESTHSASQSRLSRGWYTYDQWRQGVVFLRLSINSSRVLTWLNILT